MGRIGPDITTGTRRAHDDPPLPRLRHVRRPRLEPLEGRLLLAGGDLDPTFGAGGVVMTTFNRTNDRAETVLAQPDGKIVAVGANLVRYNANGSLDTSFGKGGTVASANANGAALYPPGTANAGKIVLVGQASSGKTK